MKLFELDKKYKLFVDLDGVLANLEEMVAAKTGKTFAELDAEGDGWYRFVAQERKAGNAIFDELNKMPDADRLWNYVVRYAPSILTATGHPEIPARAEKTRWVHDNLNGFDNIYITISGRDKSIYAAPNHILIDDMDKNVDAWNDAGGIGILHIDAETTIDTLQNMGL